jgi:hypothetical protein
MTPTSRGDGLVAEDGVFSTFGSLDYHLAVRRVLLTHPPSFSRWSYCLRSNQSTRYSSAAHPVGLVAVALSRRSGPSSPRLVTQLWGAAAEQCLGPPDARGVCVAHHPTKETFAALSPEVDWARAPLSELDVPARPGRLGRRAQTYRGSTSIGCDGETYHFAAGIRAGKKSDPKLDLRGIGRARRIARRARTTRQ